MKVVCLSYEATFVQLFYGFVRNFWSTLPLMTSNQTFQLINNNQAYNEKKSRNYNNNKTSLIWFMSKQKNFTAVSQIDALSQNKRVQTHTLFNCQDLYFTLFGWLSRKETYEYIYVCGGGFAPNFQTNYKNLFLASSFINLKTSCVCTCVLAHISFLLNPVIFVHFFLSFHSFSFKSSKEKRFLLFLIIIFFNSFIENFGNKSSLYVKRRQEKASPCVINKSFIRSCMCVCVQRTTKITYTPMNTVG